MILTKRLELGEYIIIINYADDDSGYIKVSVLDELEEEIENIEIDNDNPEDNEIDPNLN